jgi:hypothetical protein
VTLFQLRDVIAVVGKTLDDCCRNVAQTAWCAVNPTRHNSAAMTLSKVSISATTGREPRQRQEQKPKSNCSVSITSRYKTSRGIYDIICISQKLSYQQ